MNTRWDYRTIEIKPGLMGKIKPEDVQAELGRHGAQGWELVSAVAPHASLALLLFFKREAS